MASTIDENTLNAELESLPGWHILEGKLTKDFKFKHFPEALSFIVRVGLSCEKRNHHPELFNSYNRVRLQFCTHDAGGAITEKDIAIAREIERFNLNSAVES